MTETLYVWQEEQSMVDLIMLCYNITLSPIANPSCIEVHDMVQQGYKTIEKCQTRLSEMMWNIRNTIPVPHSMTIKCIKKENNNGRTT